MCAIFGYVSRGNGRPRLSTLARMVAGNIQRGPHAFGFAWIDSRGRMHCYKQSGRLVDHVGLLAMARDAVMLVGHLRWATHGSYQDQVNNHPHPADGGWIVHNGIVQNYEQLVRSWKLWPVSECDSEVLGLLMEGSSGATLASRCAAAIRATTGQLALLGLWARPATMVVARRGNPLHLAQVSEGYYLASVPEGLPGACKSLADDFVYRFSRRDGRVSQSALALPRSSSSWRPRGLFNAGAYCGG